MSDRSKAVESHEATVNELMSKLRARDQDIQVGRGAVVRGSEVEGRCVRWQVGG